MTNPACLPCRLGDSHTFHDSGDPNLEYAYEGTEPPKQVSSDAWSQEEMTAFARGLIDQPEDPDEKPQGLATQAIDLVYGDRQGAYGHPYDDYSRTAGMWSAFLGMPITPAQAALMMVLLKVSRERNRPKDDNIVDAHGYLLCYGRIKACE